VKGAGIWRYRGDLAIDTQQLIDRHLGRSHRILHREDTIVRDLDELADERQVPRSGTSLQRRLVKTGGRLVKHARYYRLMLAGNHLTRRLSASMVRRIGAPAVATG
jgi:hypothetical protein